MFLKCHQSPGIPDVLAVCDAELHNTTIVHGDMTVHIHECFYGTRRVNADEVKEALKKAENINLMGEKSVALAIEAGLITRADCIMIGQIPHVQIFRL